jgi:hypothetical protein
VGCVLGHGDYFGNVIVGDSRPTSKDKKTGREKFNPFLVFSCNFFASYSLLTSFANDITSALEDFLPGSLRMPNLS